MHSKVESKTLKRRDHMGGTGLDERIILKCILKLLYEGID
jgi:hypothetical protein